MYLWLAYFHTVAVRARTALQRFAAQEPVRLRAALTSLVLACAVFVPALATAGVAEQVGSVGVVVLPLIVGERTRAKVSPSA
ncbi:hypothetical protein ABZ446_28430 [Streptomyces sp. NPDC005813]|uniref:hypothetical protein n=1 Tax=Streptomyces sp. NPDC005813 TaxID=3155592 RepID=UPI00340CD577